MKSHYFFKIILIAIAASGLIQIFSALIQPNSHAQRKDTIVRQIIHERISDLIQNRSVLEMSANYRNDPGNILLKKCLTHPLSCNPQMEAVPFTIIKSINPPYSFLTGTNDNPAFYSANGSIGCTHSCDGWEVRSYFSIRCSAEAQECPASSVIDIFFQILPTPHNTHGKKMGALPLKLLFDDHTTADASFKLHQHLPHKSHP